MDISRTRCVNQLSKLYQFLHQNILRFSSYRFLFRTKKLGISEPLEGIWSVLLCRRKQIKWNDGWWAMESNGNNVPVPWWLYILLYCLKCFLAPVMGKTWERPLRGSTDMPSTLLRYWNITASKVELVLPGDVEQDKFSFGVLFLSTWEM